MGSSQVKADNENALDQPKTNGEVINMRNHQLKQAGTVS